MAKAKPDELEKDAQELTYCEKSIQNIMTVHYPNVEYFVVLKNETTTRYAGNGCPMCAIEDVVDWAEDMNIKHNSELEEQDDKIH